MPSPRSTRRHPACLSASLSAGIGAVIVLAGCAGPPSGSGSATGAATGSAGSATAVSLRNCGDSVAISAPPTKMVTLNQGATEVALALGLTDKLAGTAYLDDAVPAKWKQAYDSVKVLAKKYPSKEEFLAAKPDFAYAAYSSAFGDKGVGTRAELKAEGINTYLSPFGCAKGTPTAAPTFESAWSEVSDIAKIFGVTPRADELIAAQKSQLQSVRQAAAGKGKKVFWYDSGDKTPFVGSGGGGPQLILDAVGATNIFGDLKGGWADGSWEKVVAAQPDVIVLSDASWDSAKKKQDYLMADPTLSKLEAVQKKRFVTLPFSQTTPGVSLADGADSVGKQIAALPSS